MSKPNLNPAPYRDPNKLRGDEDWQVSFSDDPRPSVDEPLTQTANHKVWYVRFGQAISDFFTSIPDQFSRLWQAVRNAGEAVARFFSGRGAASDAKIATMNIRAPVGEISAAPTPNEPMPASPAVYFPIAEEKKMSGPPLEIGVLGAIPSSRSETDEPVEARTADTGTLIGKATFDAYRARKVQGQEIADFFEDHECGEYAKAFVLKAASLENHGHTLDPAQEEIRSAAREFLTERSAHREHARQKEAQQTRQLERLRSVEEQATRLPGQKDFEDFVTLFEKHRSDNTPLILVPGSRYLSQACMQYASGLPDIDARRDAIRFLDLWANNPEASLLAMKTADHFMDPPPPPPPPRRLPSRISQPVAESVVTPQAMRDVVESIAMLDADGRRKMLAGTTLTSASVDTALQALRGLVRDNDNAASAAHPSSVEFKLNYARQAAQGIKNEIDALDIAEYLLNHCKTQIDRFTSMKGVTLQPVLIDGLLDAVRKQRQTLQESRQAQRPQSPQPRQTPPKEPRKKAPTLPAKATPGTVSAASIQLLTKLRGSIDGPALMLAMYSNPQLAPNIPQLYEDALPYFDGLIISGKVDDAAKASAEMLASLWQNAKRDPIQLKKMQALPGFAILDGAFDLANLGKDFA